MFPKIPIALADSRESRKTALRIWVKASAAIGPRLMRPYEGRDDTLNESASFLTGGVL
jgi:hypothetical protein